MLVDIIGGYLLTSQKKLLWSVFALREVERDLVVQERRGIDRRYDDDRVSPLPPRRMKFRSRPVLN